MPSKEEKIARIREILLEIGELKKYRDSVKHGPKIPLGDYIALLDKMLTLDNEKGGLVKELIVSDYPNISPQRLAELVLGETPPVITKIPIK